MTYSVDARSFGGQAPPETALSNGTDDSGPSADSDAIPKAAREPAAMVTCVLVAPNDDVHVVAAPVDPEARTDGDPPVVNTEALATLLEKTADALRRGMAATTADRAADSPTLAAAGLLPIPAVQHFAARTPTAPAAPERLRLGGLEILPQSRLVLRQGEPVPLSRIEFDLFIALVRREGRPASRLELVREVWGYGAAVTSRSVDTQIYNLRHKLEENPANPRHLLTVSGVGYRVTP